MQLLVQAHPLALFLLRQSFLHFVLFSCLSARLTLAQTPFNGQVFTNGLAIVDAPQLNSQLDAGGNLNIAIDVSGDGRLSPAASTPGSGLATGFSGLDLFLVSFQSQVNLTVSTGPGLLTQEPGSTVKHLNWPIPTCIPPGQYNLTLYEESIISDHPFFSITPIPLSINNPNPNGPCVSGTNPVQSYPQPFSPPPQNPFLPSVTITQSASATTATATATIIFISIETVTSSAPGSTIEYTTTIFSTGTALAAPSSSDDSAGFVPVNAALATASFSLMWAMGVSLSLILFWG